MEHKDLLKLTADIVSAWAAHNTASTDDLVGVVTAVYRSLGTVEAGAPAVQEAPVPAVPVRKSVTPDYLVCLEDGKKLKMLKRYLRTTYGMSPEDYRAKWNLPSNYPMVAPNYAASRSAMAKSIGLGRRKAPTQPTAPTPAPKKTSRRKKAA